MMYIQEGDKSITWHVGEFAIINAAEVTMVQADGDELGYIYDHFTGLPWTRDNKVVRWFGSFAQFITGNINDKA